MTANKIEDSLRRNHVDFHQIDIYQILCFMSIPNNVKEYLNCMGKTIKWHITQYGSAWTTLYSINDLMDYQETVCSDNNLLVIGNGLNGDIITINLKNSHVGYIFHDDLWEDNYSTIEDIYRELPFRIETFLQMVFETESYPIDGTMAEEIISQ